MLWSCGLCLCCREIHARSWQTEAFKLPSTIIVYVIAIVVQNIFIFRGMSIKKSEKESQNEI